MAGVSVTRMMPNWGDYNKFVDFAKPFGKLAGRTIVVGTSSGLVKATGDKIGNTKRTEVAKVANNNVRELFKASVLKLFRLKSNEEGKLPESVKKAMALGDYNKGKPLSVRRIKAVDEAIKEWVSEGLGKNLTVKASFDNKELNQAEFALKVFGDEQKYGDVLGQISSDVYRDRSCRLSKQEEKRFVAEPYSMCNAKKGPLYGFMVNGRQVPVPKHEKDTVGVERFVNLSLANELTERDTIVRTFSNGEEPGDFIRLPKDPNDPLVKKGYAGLIVTGNGTAKAVTENELQLKRTAMYFCQQSALSFAINLAGEGGVFRGGSPVSDTSKNAIQTVNIVRSPDGSGYDVIVRQTFHGVTGLKDDKSGKMTGYYDPMKPGSWVAACAYHIGLKGGKPVVTFKERPKVWANLPKAIKKKEFASKVAEYAEAHKVEIFKELRSGTDPYWRQCSDQDLEGMLKKAVKEALDTFGRGSAVSVKTIADSFGVLRMEEI